MKEDVIAENHKQADNIDLEPVGSPSNEINSPHLAPEQANQTKVLLIILCPSEVFCPGLFQLLWNVLFIHLYPGQLGWETAETDSNKWSRHTRVCEFLWYMTDCKINFDLQNIDCYNQLLFYVCRQSQSTALISEMIMIVASYLTYEL